MIAGKSSHKRLTTLLIRDIIIEERDTGGVCLSFDAIIRNKGFTQYSLSKRTGISAGLISSYVSGKKIPGGKNLFKLSVALGCTTDFILQCIVDCYYEA